MRYLFVAQSVVLTDMRYTNNLKAILQLIENSILGNSSRRKNSILSFGIKRLGMQQQSPYNFLHNRQLLHQLSM